MSKSDTAREPVLLTGGNPQIAKGCGDGPVQAYVAAMPGWKRAVGERLDALIERAIPGVRKAVKWNTPLYGAPDGPDDWWLLGYNCTTKYVKVAFFQGGMLDPPPPVPSRQEAVRYFHIHEDDPFDEVQFAEWVRQASRQAGVKM